MRLAMLVNDEHLTKLFLWPIFRKAFPENGGEEILGTKLVMMYELISFIRSQTMTRRGKLCT